GEDLAQARPGDHEEAGAARTRLGVAGEVDERSRRCVLTEAARLCHRQDAITEFRVFRVAAGRLVMTASTPSAASERSSAGWSAVHTWLRAPRARHPSTATWSTSSASG